MSTLPSHLRHAELDLDGLIAAARELLAGAPPPRDPRAAAEPDGRTVRYYQSLGILGRPLRYDGRRAVYGYRHLLELAAVKLLQADGLSLAQVQRALAAAATPALESAVAAALAGHPTSPSNGTTPAPRPTSDAPIAARVDAAPTGAARRPWVSAEVAPGVVVAVDPARVADPPGVLATLAAALSQPPGGTG